ncbi:MAG TPA: PEP-CTERM sorting domain-containing protein [Armatimonadota bacterium]|nr:PEP-CTERM sorting domain-containing protein [Armatimonadota bacterium]
MKWLRFCMIAALMLFAVQCLAVAPPPSAVKYSQPPNMEWSYDLSSETKQPPTGGPNIYESLMADDWLCNATGTVTDIHWWGSYWTPYPGEPYADYSDSRPNAPAGGIVGFNIAIWTDVPASAQNPYSHPGTMIKPISITGNANETPAFQVTDPSGFLTHDVYKYDIDLSTNDQFNQLQDTIYWLSIQAILPDLEKQWGWHETTTIHNDIGVMKKGVESSWFIPCGGHDMAFELTTVPEPSGILVILSGLSGILGVAFRRRK